jgi:hypothetical protein
VTIDNIKPPQFQNEDGLIINWEVALKWGEKRRFKVYKQQEVALFLGDFLIYENDKIDFGPITNKSSSR